MKNKNHCGIARRATTLGAAFAVAAGLCFASPAYAEYLGYPDLEESHWAVAGGVIDWSEENGVIHGFPDGRWAPDETISRSQVATVLWNYEGNPDSGEESTFDDAATIGWASDAAAWAQEEGVFTGYENPDGTVTFGGENPLTREQAAKVLRAYVGGEAPTSVDFSGFRDPGSVSSWAIGEMAWAVDEGVVSGFIKDDGKYLNGQLPCTRAEFVTMLMRALGEEEPSNPGTDPSDPVDPTPDPDPGTDPEDPSVDPDPTPDPDPGTDPEPVPDPDPDPGYSANDLGNGTFKMWDGNNTEAVDGGYSNVWFNGYELIGLQENFATVEDAQGNRLKCAGAYAAEPPFDFTVTKTVNWDDKTIDVTAHGMGAYTGELTITVKFREFSSVYTGSLYCPECNRGCVEFSPTDWRDYPQYLAYICADSDHWGSGGPTYGFHTSHCDFLDHKNLEDVVVNGRTTDAVLVDAEELLQVPAFCVNPNCINYHKQVENPYVGYIAPNDDYDFGFEVQNHDASGNAQ